GLDCISGRLLGERPLLDAAEQDQLRDLRARHGYALPDVSRYVFSAGPFPPDRVPGGLRRSAALDVRLLALAVEEVRHDCSLLGEAHDFQTPGGVAGYLGRSPSGPVRLVVFVSPLSEDASRRVAVEDPAGFLDFDPE